MNAFKLCRAMDREQFRLIRANPKDEVPRFLAENGITVRCADPFYTESLPIGEVTNTEYEIYTSLFRTDLFVFDRGNTTIDNRTGIVGIDRPSFSSELVSDAFTEEIDDPKELFSEFCSLNGHRYELAPRFVVPNGYTLCDTSNHGGNFVISRAALNESQTIAVAYLGYFGGPLVGAGHLIGFVNSGGSWRIAGQTMLWIS